MRMKYSCSFAFYCFFITAKVYYLFQTNKHIEEKFKIKLQIVMLFTAATSLTFINNDV